jgi:hypothetical protein
MTIVCVYIRLTEGLPFFLSFLAFKDFLRNFLREGFGERFSFSSAVSPLSGLSSKKRAGGNGIVSFLL